MNRRDPQKWRSLIDRHDLLFDHIRLRLAEVAHRASGATTVQAAIDFWERSSRTLVPGGLAGNMPGPPIRPGESLIDAYARVVREEYEPPQIKAARGHPMPWEHTLFASEWGASAAAFLAELTALSPSTRLFVADSRLVSDVIRSRNEPLTGEDLELLPFPQTWVEFDHPVWFADGYTRPLEVRAVGFWSAAGSPLRMAWIVSSVKLKAGGLKHTLDRQARLLEAEGALFLMFWGRKRVLGTNDRELSIHLGYDPDAPGDTQGFQDFLRQAETSAKNLYDFLTCRSFDYTTEERPPRRTFPKRFRHLQGGLAQGPRHYRRVILNKAVGQERQPGGSPPEWVGADCTVDVPGCFHRYLYCRACGDLHRHDLIGSPCRKCAELVGPTANVRLEKYWHCPHRRGSGPVKEHVRHMVP